MRRGSKNKGVSPCLVYATGLLRVRHTGLGDAAGQQGAISCSGLFVYPRTCPVLDTTGPSWKGTGHAPHYRHLAQRPSTLPQRCRHSTQQARATAPSSHSTLAQGHGGTQTHILESLLYWSSGRVTTTPGPCAHSSARVAAAARPSAAGPAAAAACAACCA